MRVKQETSERDGFEVIDYNLDGSPIYDDRPRTFDVYTYYDSNGEIIGRTFDDFLWCLIDDSTESKLSAIAHSVGATLTAPDKWRLCCLIHRTFDDARLQFVTGHAIRNQEALRQLISAFEALSGDQSVLMDSYRSNIGVSWREFPLGRKDTPASIFMRTAKSFLDKGMITGKPPTLEGCLSFLRDEMETFFIDLGLDPEGEHQTCFNKWMETLLNDPDIKREKAEWYAEKEKADALLKEKMPDTVRGKKIANVYSDNRERKDSVRRAEWLRYPEYLDKYFKRNSSHRLTDGRRACAKNFGVSLKTITRRTKGYEKPGTS